MYNQFDDLPSKQPKTFTREGNGHTGLMHWNKDPDLLWILCHSLLWYESKIGHTPSNHASATGVWGEQTRLELWAWVQTNFPKYVPVIRAHRIICGGSWKTIHRVLGERVHKKMRWEYERGERIGSYTKEHPYYKNRKIWNEASREYAVRFNGMPNTRHTTVRLPMSEKWAKKKLELLELLER